MTVLIVCLEDEPLPTTPREVLGLLGVDPGPRQDVRWHRPELFSLHGWGGDEDLLARLRDRADVRRVVSFPDTSRLFQPTAGVERGVRVGAGVVIGAGEPSMIAGPCAVEGDEQIRSAAGVVADAGAAMLRGGVFKPRTTPYAFGGLGQRGLELLARAGEEAGLPTVTEALAPENLDAVCAHADMVQIGSRNMHNFPLLFDAGAHPSGRPILLKRGLAATIDELLEAAEYVLLGRLFAGHDHPGLVLCERGIRTFESSTRFTLDIGAIPVLQQRCALPVIADPSHAAGTRELVAPLARAAVAAGAEGLLVEVHPDPEQAWCDARQALSPADFRALMGDLGLRRPRPTPAFEVVH